MHPSHVQWVEHLKGITSLRFSLLFIIDFELVLGIFHCMEVDCDTDVLEENVASICRVEVSG